MITKLQIEALSKEHQIDGVTIMREFLQLTFLNYLYQHGKGKEIYFKGGTAIRLLFNSPRFSEDLDFSTHYDKKQIGEIMRDLEGTMQKELPGVKILFLYSGKTGIRYHVAYQPVDFKYPINIRLDFTIVKKIEQAVISPLVTKFPIAVFPLVSHLSDKEILAEKICALATRNKGRDLYDVWYLLGKKVLLNQKLVKIKFLENHIKFNNNDLLKKIELYPQNRLNQDLAQFLPKYHRPIVEILKNLLIEKLSEIK
ncbi:MAG: nucleotidyl transferase AbiEii/AbiGii toxin family protein [Candidatus Woesebacteria bacterium]|nr:nucleotidyl transferase AbiEii/AbiGii toxin family protein [Candidatus Woesebacteria bacterium]